MTPQQYIAIIRAEHRLTLARFQFMLAERDYTDVVRAAGLDPTKPLQYDDAGLNIAPVAEDAPQQ